MSNNIANIVKNIFTSATQHIPDVDVHYKAAQSNTRSIVSKKNPIVKKFRYIASSSELKYTKVVINTVSDAPLIPNQTPIITTNGFLFIHTDGNKYIVTTAHAFFSTAQTPDDINNLHTGKIQTAITVNINNKIHHFSSSDIIYSRSLDVAFIKVVSDEPALSISEFNTEAKLGDKCFVKYTDMLSRTDSIVEGKYVPFTQGQIDMFAMTNASSSGTSGSPVGDDKGKILGMISASPGETSDYANMTLCVPIDTIKLLIEKGKALETWVDKNLDEGQRMFAGVFVNSIQPQVSLYIDSVDGGLRSILDNAGGQRVIYSDKDSKLYPWDIITKVSNQKIGGNSKSLNKVLLEGLDSNADLTMEGYRIDDYYFERFLRVSTMSYCGESIGNKQFLPRSEIVQAIFRQEGNVIKFPSDGGGLDKTVFDHVNDETSLFYIGQQIQYSKLEGEDDAAQLKSSKDFFEFNRSFATIVDIDKTAGSITLNKSLTGNYLIAIIPLTIAGKILYLSPMNYNLSKTGKSIMSRTGDLAIAVEGKAEPVGNNFVRINPATFKNDIGTTEVINRIDHKSSSLSHNVFVVSSFVNLLFLMIGNLQASEQEKINVLQTEINYLYKILQTHYKTEKSFVDTVKGGYLYWVFFSSAINRFGINAITMLSAIPDPPYPPGGEDTDWDAYKEKLFGPDLYSNSVSTYITNMKAGAKGVGTEVFNTSLFNTQNGWFYGKISDRSNQTNELGIGANTASQTLEMILEDLTPSGTDGKTYLTNLTSINYLMELNGVSWNNLLIAHNWRKKKGLKSKLIFNKI